jgi:AcrR family transcriptional regulator
MTQPVTPLPKTKWGDRVTREQDIRSSALEVLARDGYAKASMRAVADGAGVSLGTVYTYFPSKEDLYAALYAERLHRLAGEIAAESGKADSLREALFLAAHRYLEVYRVFGRDFNVAAAMAGKSTLEGEAAADLVTASMGVLTTVSALLARFEPDAYDALADRQPLVMQLVWTSMNGMADHLSSVRTRVFGSQPDELLTFMVDVLIRGLRDIAGN